jgi:hypothetical protein
MIDNVIFLIIICLVPWLCYKGAKIDHIDREALNQSATRKKKN